MGVDLRRSCSSATGTVMPTTAAMIQTRQRASRIASRSVSQPLPNIPISACSAAKQSRRRRHRAERQRVGAREEGRVPRHHGILREAVEHPRNHHIAEGARVPQNPERGEQRRRRGRGDAAGLEAAPHAARRASPVRSARASRPVQPTTAKLMRQPRAFGQKTRAGIAHHQPRRQSEAPCGHGGGATKRADNNRR